MTLGMESWGKGNWLRNYEDYPVIVMFYVRSYRKLKAKYKRERKFKHKLFANNLLQ